ncbi:MAG: hypothetical protein M1570_03575 [Chloroflexi bacterium]|nr:hypothetical protein [Chloroflexota bacterium]
MDVTSLILFFAGIAISAAIFALLIFFYPRLVERGPSTEGIAKDVDRALLPLVFYGISAGFRTTERATNDGYPLLEGSDKKGIADSVYDVLPEHVGDIDLEEVKKLITRPRFEQMIQDAYNGFDSFYKENKIHFDQEYETWKQKRRQAVVEAQTGTAPQSK